MKLIIELLAKIGVLVPHQPDAELSRREIDQQIRRNQ